MLLLFYNVRLSKEGSQRRGEIEGGLIVKQILFEFSAWKAVYLPGRSSNRGRKEPEWGDKGQHRYNCRRCLPPKTPKPTLLVGDPEWYMSWTAKARS